MARATSHNALGVLDIVHYIVEHVCNDSRLISNARILGRLVQVNRMFYEAALPKLWRELYRPDPFFDLLPLPSDLPPVGSTRQAKRCANVEAAEAEPTEPTHSSDSSVILNDRISRFREHARLVRVLDLSTEDAQRCISAKQPLFERVGLPLLPFLSKLSLEVSSSPPEYSQLTQIASHSLRELEITITSWLFTDGIDRWLNNVFTTAVHLTHLKLSFESFVFMNIRYNPFISELRPFFRLPSNPYGRTRLNIALTAVKQCRELEVFHLVSEHMEISSPNLLRALSTLPKLREVACGLLPKCDSHLLHPGFDNLKILTVTHFSHGDELLVFRSPHLHTLRLYQKTSQTPIPCQETARIVGQRFTHLRDLFWHAPFAESQPDSFATLIRPLFSLRQLETLAMNVGMLTVPDSDIEALAAGLPQLRQLTLEYRVKHSAPDAIMTTRALLALAQACPVLESLDLHYVHMPEADLGAVEGCPCMMHGLKTLRISDLQCAAGNICAMILDRLFPFLDVTYLSGRSRSFQRMSAEDVNFKSGDVLDRLAELRMGRRS